MQQRGEQELSTGKVTIHHEFSFAVLAGFDDYYFDWVYIDSNHTYVTSRIELGMCRAKVKSEGIITGHDYIKGNWKGNGAAWHHRDSE